MGEGPSVASVIMPSTCREFRYLRLFKSQLGQALFPSFLHRATTGLDKTLWMTYNQSTYLAAIWELNHARDLSQSRRG